MDNTTDDIKEKDRLDLYREEIEHRENLIKKALELWYDLIGGDHHKDRDCHFYIEREYSTYRPGTWSVYHNGYILKDYKEEFPTFEQALQGLLTFLLEKIAEEISLTLQHFDDLVQQGERKPEDKEIWQKYMKRLEIIVLSQYYDVEKEEKDVIK